jgi:hypothetical protein
MDHFTGCACSAHLVSGVTRSLCRRRGPCAGDAILLQPRHLEASMHIVTPFQVLDPKQQSPTAAVDYAPHGSSQTTKHPCVHPSPIHRINPISTRAPGQAPEI